MTNETKFHFPLDPAQPEVFIDYTLLLLVSTNDALELNEVLGAFLAEDVIEYVERNKDMFFILGEIWNETIRKIIFDSKDVTFPDGLLLLPPLFHSLGWAVENESWTPYQCKFEKLNQQEPNLVYALILLFIQGMQYELSDAQLDFANRIAEISGEDRVHAQRFEDSLKYFGWPIIKEFA